MGVVGGEIVGLLTFLELPACDVALGHGRRQGGHGEVLGSTVGRCDTESCNGYALDGYRKLTIEDGELTTTAMSADDGSSEPAGTGKGDHCQCKNRRRVGDNNNNDDDELYAAALLSTITKTAWGDPKYGPSFSSDSTLSLPNFDLCSALT
jgi:hypothetical protein